jgi:HSP20 family molecular chaperone IbpA
LTIRGQRIDRSTTAGDVLHFHQVERGHGAFARTFEFASNIDVESVSADLTNGVLTVTLPKAARPPARKIEVR